jgi:hypothetical protein
MDNGITGGAGASRDACRRVAPRLLAPRQPGPGHAVVVAAAAAGFALLVTACGGGGPAAAGKSPAYQKALAYSQCMRSHGVPGWPDPDTQGMVSASQVQQASTGTSQLQLAEAACAHLQPSGHYIQVNPAQLQKLTAEGLKFADCMRSHGIANFPDPDQAHLQNGQLGFGMTGIDTNSPQYQSAQKACEALLPGNAGSTS